MDCKFAGVCGACSKISEEYEVQKVNKISEFNLAFSSFSNIEELSFTGFPEGGLRDRVDLSFKRLDGKSVFGFYHIDGGSLVDIAECPQMSSSLSSWYQEFREDLPPMIDKASFRLRVSPKGLKGLWIDMANVDIKTLLVEGDWLTRVSQNANVVEVGQRRKKLIRKEGKWKLADPLSDNWFETYLGEELKPFSLKMNIGSFSQPGFKSNRSLIQTVFNFLQDLAPMKVLELCSGSGNLSFALASLGHDIVATELDRAAIANANESKEDFPKDLGEISFKRLNAHKDSPELTEELQRAELLVVDPPRSGMGSSLDCILNLKPEEMPSKILYVSCHLKSASEDCTILCKEIYEVRKVELLDQFSHSPHCEYVLLLEKK